MAESRSRTTSRAARPRDDRAVAGVIGFVLVLAVVVSYYAYVAKENVPRWGADNERAWDRRVAESMVRLARDAAGAAGSQSSVAGVVPGVPEPKAFEVPLLGRTEPVAPSGTLTFHTKCAHWWLNGTLAGAATVQFPYESAADADGCLEFRSHPVYSDAWGYRYEYGALLRVESEKAVMVAGPPLKLRTLTTGGSVARYELALTLVDLRGPGASSTADRTNVPLDLIAGPHSGTPSDPAAADRTVWTLKTQHPDAWKNWFNQRFRGAGFDESLNGACVAADGAAASGPCAGQSIPPDEVRVVLHGPRTTAEADLSVSFAHATYDVSIR